MSMKGREASSRKGEKCPECGTYAVIHSAPYPCPAPGLNQYRDAGRESTRADVYREVAALVNDLPRDWTPQRVAEVIAESADQLSPPARKPS